MLAADLRNVNRDGESRGTVYLRMSFGTARVLGFQIVDSRRLLPLQPTGDHH